jgi:hypothetical protein
VCDEADGQGRSALAPALETSAAVGAPLTSARCSCGTAVCSGSGAPLASASLESASASASAASSSHQPAPRLQPASGVSAPGHAVSGAGPAAVTLSRMMSARGGASAHAGGAAATQPLRGGGRAGHGPQGAGGASAGAPASATPAPPIATAPLSSILLRLVAAVAAGLGPAATCSPGAGSRSLQQHGAALRQGGRAGDGAAGENDARAISGQSCAPRRRARRGIGRARYTPEHYRPGLPTTAPAAGRAAPSERPTASAAPGVGGARAGGPPGRGP